MAAPHAAAAVQARVPVVCGNMASQALQVVDAEVLGCVRRLADAHRLHAAERRCGLATAPGSLAALAVGEADDSYLQVPLGMKRDGTTGAPD